MALDELIEYLQIQQFPNPEPINKKVSLEELKMELSISENIGRLYQTFIDIETKYNPNEPQGKLRRESLQHLTYLLLQIDGTHNPTRLNFINWMLDKKEEQKKKLVLVYL